MLSDPLHHLRAWVILAILVALFGNWVYEHPERRRPALIVAGIVVAAFLVAWVVAL